MPTMVDHKKEIERQARVPKKKKAKQVKDIEVEEKKRIKTNESTSKGSRQRKIREKEAKADHSGTTVEITATGREQQRSMKTLGRLVQGQLWRPERRCELQGGRITCIEWRANN